jgi:ferric-dicitrate binding protein FerR (iron transport regulator)
VTQLERPRFANASTCLSPETRRGATQWVACAKSLACGTNDRETSERWRAELGLEQAGFRGRAVAFDDYQEMGGIRHAHWKAAPRSLDAPASGFPA